LLNPPESGRRRNHPKSLGDCDELATAWQISVCSGLMARHSSPTIKGFLWVIWCDWGALMSGIFTVPFTIAAVLFPSGDARAIFGTMAVLAFLFTAYRIWADERRQLVTLEQHLAPRLRIEFDPKIAKCVSPTRTVNGIEMRYIRVIVRALSPIVRDCRAYLDGISYWDGTGYIALFDEQLPMPWSYEDPVNIVPRVLNHDVDALLDVAWLADPKREMQAFGILNARSSLPNSFQPVWHWIVEHPTHNLKLDILVTATDSESARFSLNVHRGAPDWKQAQIGWMKGNEILLDSNT
jgi:hypothetical protein